MTEAAREVSRGGEWVVRALERTQIPCLYTAQDYDAVIPPEAGSVDVHDALAHWLDWHDSAPSPQALGALLRRMVG